MCIYIYIYIFFFFFLKNKFVLVIKKFCKQCYWTKLGSTLPRSVKPIYWQQLVRKESAVFITRHQARRMGSSRSKHPNSLMTFMEGFWKAGEGEGHRVHDQLVYSSLIGWWWADRVIFQETQLPVFWLQAVWGLCAGGQHAGNFFHVVGVSVSAKQLKGHGSE